MNSSFFGGHLYNKIYFLVNQQIYKKKIGRRKEKFVDKLSGMKNKTT
jgi:hypothetical protein